MFPPILPPFPDSPRALTTRQLECVRCREVFTIAEDNPERIQSRSDEWQVPKDQYPSTPLRFNRLRNQIGIMTEIRTKPIQTIQGNKNWSHKYHLNCPRCGTDNRNWLFVTDNMRPLFARAVIIGFFLSMLIVAAILISRWFEFFQDRFLATICLILAAVLPLLIIPFQWPAMREHRLAQRFLQDQSIQRTSPIVNTIVFLSAILVICIPGIRYGLVPIVQQIISIARGAVLSPTSEVIEVANELTFLADWLYLGSVTIAVSSTFAMLGVNEILGRINNQLPRPIFANTANMVRVTLWEAKRALEIGNNFRDIQWMMTSRNDNGGIEMEGHFRDPPEMLPNGHLDEDVRVQIFTISTDRWCNIIHTQITDERRTRPAGGKYYAIPLPNQSSNSKVTVGRNKY